MVVVRTIEEFQRHNEKELRTFMISKTGILDKDMINEAIQECYIRLISTRSLEKFKDGEAASYNTWVCNLLCWVLSGLKKKNFNQRFNPISHVRANQNNSFFSRDTEIWEHINSNKDFILDKSINADLINDNSIDKTERLKSSFIRYLYRVSSKEKADFYVKYMQYSEQGMTSESIAPILNTTGSVLCHAKKKLLKKMKKWRETVSCGEWY